MRIKETFPHKTRIIENAWIPMRDGVHLAARIWLPEDAEQHPVPAILEYIPYRKRDGTAPRDSLHMPYFAGHGYAGVRVDIRGSGDSEGVLTDEYLESELADGDEILRWLADQPWCTGDVGMIGISWGGFNGLQMAYRQPPELKAVITVCSTDDRYADDVHYMGGCLLGDHLSWASTMFALNSLPPDPMIVGDRWRDMWNERLEGSGLWLETWLEHQHRDAFWKHGSICEDFSRVQVPVMAVSGWADGYSNAVFRLLKNLPHVPRQGLVGPWSHKYPHIGVPGPAIDWLGECLRWWDRWLKGDETNGIMDEPMLRAFMQESHPPDTAFAEKPGHWVAEPEWPSDTVARTEHPLAANRILQPGETAKDRTMELSSPLSTGLFAGKWCSYSAGPDLAGDQREEDGGALTFDSEPLEEDVQILGKPWVTLRLSVDRPVAMVAVRLSDVRPNGEATRVTYGVLNLTHHRGEQVEEGIPRQGHETPEPLEPGRTYTIKLKMNDIAQTFRKGHAIRLSVSTVYWPLAWPAPEPVVMRVETGGSSIELPIRQPRPEDAAVAFDPPQAAPPMEKQVLDPGFGTWRVERELAQNRSTLEVVKDDGTHYLPDIDLSLGTQTYEWYRTRGNDHESPEGETFWRFTLERGDWRVETVTRCKLSCDDRNFHINAELDAWEGDARVHSRNWNLSVPRKLV